MYLATLPAIIFLKSIYVHIWRCMYFPFCGVPLNIVYLCICLSVENVWVVRSGFLFVCFVFLLFISPGTLFRWNNSLNWRNIIVPASVNEMLLCVCCVCVCAWAQERVHTHKGLWEDVVQMMAALPSGSPSDLQIRFLGATFGTLPGATTPGIVCYKATRNNLMGAEH